MLDFKWWAVLGSNQWPLPCETEVGCLQIKHMRAVPPIATRTCCHLISLDITQCHGRSVPKLSQRSFSRVSCLPHAGSYMDAPRLPSVFSASAEAGRDCSHTFGLGERRLAAGPDGMSWLTPDQIGGLLRSLEPGRIRQPRSDLFCITSKTPVQSVVCV